MTLDRQKKARRKPGTGSVFRYTLSGGKVRFGIKFMVELPDGTKKQVLRRKDRNGKPWIRERDAETALRKELVRVDDKEWIDPSKHPLGAYLDDWADSLRLKPSTVASYKKNIRLHLKPHIGEVRLASLTSAKITGLYRMLRPRANVLARGTQPARVCRRARFATSIPSSEQRFRPP